MAGERKRSHPADGPVGLVAQGPWTCDPIHSILDPYQTN